MGNRLNPGDQLKVDQELISENAYTRLIMQGDGNLVEYETRDGQPLWASQTYNTGATHAIMQGDGNLVVYTDANVPKWASGTYNNPGAYATLESDGALVVYSASGVPLWSNNIHVGPNHKIIPPQHKKWEQDYYAITSVDYDPDTRISVIEQNLTNTFKFAPFLAGAKVLFYGGDKTIIGSADYTLQCPAGNVLGGAGHASQVVRATAPEGTQGFALAQYYKPEGIAELAHEVEQLFADIGDFIGQAIDGSWCRQNPDACNAIGLSLLIIAGALCLAFPESCEIVISVGLS